VLLFEVTKPARCADVEFSTLSSFSYRLGNLLSLRIYTVALVTLLEMERLDCDELSSGILGSRNFPHEDLARHRTRDQPNLTLRTRYLVNRSLASFAPNLRGLERSSSSSGDSFSSDTSTEATSASTDDDFTTIRGLCFAQSSSPSAFNAYSPAQQRLLEHVKSHLHDVLKKVHNYFIRLRLVGQTPSECRPAIVLATSSVRTKMTLASYLFTGPPFMARLRECRLDLHILLTSAGAACGLDNETCELQTIDEDALVEAPPTCGTRIVTHPRNSNRRRNCVAGGVLLVGGKRMLLAPHHIFACSEDASSVWHSASQSLDLENTSDEDKAVVSFYYDQHEDCPGLPEEPGQTSPPFDAPKESTSRTSSTTPKDNTGILWTPNEPNHCDGLLDNECHLAINKHNFLAARVKHRGETSDATLLEVSSSQFDCAALGTTANKIAGTIINQTHIGHPWCPLPVTIALPDGEVKGTLHTEKVFYTVGNNVYGLRRVTVDSPLKRGCSGAPVAHKNELCGIIIAISDEEAEVYILPFEEIVRDLEQVSGCRVELPKEDTSTDSFSSLVSQDEGIRNQPNESYKPHLSKFFRRGKVFAMVWADNTSQALHSTANAVGVPLLRDCSTPSPRRLIVFSRRKGYCLAASIPAYGGRGLFKRSTCRTKVGARAILSAMKKEIGLDQCNEGSTARKTSLSLVGERFGQISLSDGSARQPSSGPFVGSSYRRRTKTGFLKRRSLPSPRQSVSTSATQPPIRSLAHSMHYDGLILSEQDLKHYDSHLRITEDYDAERRSDHSTKEPDRSGLSVNEMKRWVRPERISPNDDDRRRAGRIWKKIMIEKAVEFPGEYTDRGLSQGPLRNYGSMNTAHAVTDLPPYCRLVLDQGRERPLITREKATSLGWRELHRGSWLMLADHIESVHRPSYPLIWYIYALNRYASEVPPTYDLQRREILLQLLRNVMQSYQQPPCTQQRPPH